jgi:hypothetical protein
MERRRPSTLPLPRLARRSSLVVVTLLVIALAGPVLADDFGYRVPLAQQPSGSLYVHGQINTTVTAEFLLDTGSGLVTVGRKLFAKIRRAGAVEKTGRVAARLANGRIQAVDLYLVQRFRLGESCELGPVEIAVMPGDGPNILGMSALARAAPFAVHLVPPALALSTCIA